MGCGVFLPDDRLMRSEKADIVFMDPPYNVNFDGRELGELIDGLTIIQRGEVYSARSESTGLICAARVEGTKAAATAANNTIVSPIVYASTS